MRYSILQVQRALNYFGASLETDGIMGPATEKAISEFKAKNGLKARPYIGPLTEELLFNGKYRREVSHLYTEGHMPTWLTEISRYMGLHEIRDNKKLRKWLKSDGSTLGDPAKLPWCGDAVHTALRLALPNEPFPGKLGKNPYWARNWVLLGEASTLKYGCIVVLSRKSGGHVAFAVGYDPKRKRIRVRGGNQSNSINDTWVSEKRVLGYRKPSTWKFELLPIPLMNSKGQVVSKNEA